MTRHVVSIRYTRQGNLQFVGQIPIEPDLTDTMLNDLRGDLSRMAAYATGYGWRQLEISIAEVPDPPTPATGKAAKPKSTKAKAAKLAATPKPPKPLKISNPAKKGKKKSNSEQQPLL